MDFLKYLFIKFYQIYLFNKLEKTVIKTISLDYCMKILEHIHSYSYRNYTHRKAGNITIELRFKNAEACCDLLRRAVYLIRTNGYLDDKFILKLNLVETYTLDDFLTTNNGTGLDVITFVSVYSALLKDLSESLSGVTNSEKRSYYERRLNVIMPSLVEITEGLLKAVK